MKRLQQEICISSPSPLRRPNHLSTRLWSQFTQIQNQNVQLQRSVKSVAIVNHPFQFEYHTGVGDITERAWHFLPPSKCMSCSPRDQTYPKIEFKDECHWKDITHFEKSKISFYSSDKCSLVCNKII